jgi:hypothetical protein
MNPLCFVLMPFGKKPHEQGNIIDFDAVYREIIYPAIAAAELDPIRADEEQVGGTIHKPMFERLFLCEYAIADLTGANPNVYYELGVRHARRPRSTVLLFCEGTKLPFDISLLRGMFYKVDGNGVPLDAATTAAAITKQLTFMRHNPHDDSPVFQLIEGLTTNEKVAHEKTDIFREQAEYSRAIKAALTKARKEGIAAIDKIAAAPRLQLLNEVETGVIVDLMLSYRAVKGWQGMIALYERMPEPLQRTTMVQEQFAFALNRAGRGDEAEHVLSDLIAARGASSETNGLLGRVYKDRWKEARAAGDESTAEGELGRAVDTYVAGFEADWRDPYPGINSLTLLSMLPEPDERFDEMLPVVRYAALKRARRPSADYWDYATMVELEVLAEDKAAARKWLGGALSRVREEFEPETTADNLALICERRAEQSGDTAWIADIETNLRRKAETIRQARPAAS